MVRVFFDGWKLFNFSSRLSRAFVFLLVKQSWLVPVISLNVIYLSKEHQGVHKNSFRNVRAFQNRIGIWKCWFLRRGENRSTRRKTSRSRVENQQQTQPTYDAGSGNRTLDTLVGGERSHHCAIPASPNGKLFAVTMPSYSLHIKMLPRVADNGFP